MFLEDDSLISLAESDIDSGKNAEAAWMNAIETFAQQLEALSDPTLSARAVDLRDVGQRVLWHLMGLPTRQIKPLKPSIILSRDLTPSDTVSLERGLTLGLSLQKAARPRIRRSWPKRWGSQLWWVLVMTS